MNLVVRYASFWFVAFTSGIVLGCTKNNPQSVPSPSEESSTPESSAPNTGPEGTYLHLAGANGSYEITIMNLDGARTFKGSTAGDHIDFERDGTKESLWPTDGNDTGMKWLAGKADCLTVKRGEGYCRD